jgi:formylglycine-generating enzyme required for sulfatase activity
MSEERLLSLGYQILHVHGVKVILPPLVLIPGGGFLMGCDLEVDPEGDFDEKPLHQIVIQDFYLAKYPVTVAEYQCALDAGALDAPQPKIGNYHDQHPELSWEEQQLHPDFPVRALNNWFDAFHYAQWLAALTGRSWRLPTEAEWERAAKGADGRRYPWGNEWDPERVQSRWGGEQVRDVSSIGMHPQGASPYGVDDMSGNVQEWTSSLYRHYPYDPDDGREDPLIQDEYAVARGGSWLDDPYQMRTTYRNDATIWDEVGFRLACSLEQTR